MSTLSVTSKVVPADTEFPGSVQGLVNLLAQYLGVTGGETEKGVNYGSTTPAVGDRDKPWLKTAVGGNPIGLFSWNGTEWKQTPLTTLSGTTANRPVSPTENLQYFDTDIKTAIVFERGKWRTLSGTPGDIKFVSKTTLADAIKHNPGWVEFADGRGRVLGVAGAGPGLTTRTFNEQVGVESVALATTELPAHDHAINFKPYSGAFQNGPQPAGVLPLVTGTGNSAVSSKGDNKPHQNMQPTIFLWCLIKE